MFVPRQYEVLLADCRRVPVECADGLLMDPFNLPAGSRYEKGQNMRARSFDMHGVCMWGEGRLNPAGPPPTPSDIHHSNIYFFPEALL
jgi:hypothetical protein